MRYRRSFPWIRLVVLTTVGVVYAASVAKIGPRVGDLRQSKGVVLLALACVGALGLAAAAGAVWIFAPEWWAVPSAVSDMTGQRVHDCPGRSAFPADSGKAGGLV
jgi:hypothetical protein